MSKNNVGFTHPRSVRFQCTRCTLCCGDTKTKARHILVLEREARRISQRVSKPIGSFVYRIFGRNPYVYEMRKNKEGKCVFLRGNVCNIYTSRPLICRYYPFQLETMESGRHAFSSTKECPGVGKGKRLTRDFLEALYRRAQRELVDKREDGVKRSRR